MKSFDEAKASGHEGEMLAAIIKEHFGDNKSAFAEKAKVKPTSVGRYLEKRQWSDESWGHVCVGLKAMKLDPGMIRPQATANRLRPWSENDLLSQVATWDQAHLETLQEILSLESDDSRRELSAAVHMTLLRLQR